MRTPFQPYGGVSPIIDKMIGNAYDVIKYVARYLKEIRYVAENMDMIYNAANAGKMRIAYNANNNTNLSIALPNEVTFSAIDYITVSAQYNGVYYSPGPDSFSYEVDENNISIAMTNNELRFADFKIVFHQSTAE